MRAGNRTARSLLISLSIKRDGYTAVEPAGFPSAVTTLLLHTTPTPPHPHGILISNRCMRTLALIKISTNPEYERGFLPPRRTSCCHLSTPHELIVDCGRQRKNVQGTQREGDAAFKDARPSQRRRNRAPICNGDSLQRKERVIATVEEHTGIFLLIPFHPNLGVPAGAAVHVHASMFR
ncbi:hypothetical protein D4764_02G0012080 [Takifugu flavidus]|uniref:Uncharacterized protein n=1 Tax=Takifugu flavidus TaxID=433684 RepID=A0A5C6NR76_9TELE|nr:hypothetical protein D4764_02G0012080 [Takifugu flavidus]